MMSSPNSWKNSLQLIAWDLDGTLYPFNAELNQVIRGRQLAAVATVQKMKPDEAEAKLTVLYHRLHSHTKALKELGIDGERFFVETWQELDLEPYIRPDYVLAEALVKLSHRYTQVLLTNSNNQATVSKKLNLLGIPQAAFAGIYTSVVTGFLKPDPQAFTQVITDWQLKPQQALYIGDRETTDIIPAHQLGWRTILVATKPADANATTVADLRVSSAMGACRWLLE